MQRAASALTAIFEEAIAAAPAELQPETRTRMRAVVVAGLERLERAPPDAVGIDELAPDEKGYASA
jgi:hypothetical protein